MTNADDSALPHLPHDPLFAETRWSVILEARDANSPRAAEALETLCKTYWYPLYAFLRRKGEAPEDARDLTQGFFARLIEKDYLGDVGREKGKFRAFLLAALKHFAADERDKARAQKRGGGQPMVSLEVDDGENRYCHEPADGLDPEKLYDRGWALTVLARARELQRQVHGSAGKLAEFDRLLALEERGPGDGSYAEAAAAWGITETGVRVAASRFRTRYRQLVRREIAATLRNPTDAEVDEELRYLIQVLTT